MTTLSRSEVWSNDGRLCGREVEEARKGMKKDRTSGRLQLSDRLRSYQMGDLQKTQRRTHSLFLWPAILLHPPIPPPVLHRPGATWVGCSDLYLCACVCHMYMNVRVLEHKTNLLEFLVIDSTLVTDAIHICAQILSWSFRIIFLLIALNERTWSLSWCKIMQRSFTQDLNSNKLEKINGKLQSLIGFIKAETTAARTSTFSVLT